MCFPPPPTSASGPPPAPRRALSLDGIGALAWGERQARRDFTKACLASLHTPFHRLPAVKVCPCTMLRRLFAMLGVAAFLATPVVLGASLPCLRQCARAPGVVLVQVASSRSHYSALTLPFSSIGRDGSNQTCASRLAVAAEDESWSALGALDELSGLAVRRLVLAVALAGGRRSAVLFVLYSRVAQVHAAPRKRGRVRRQGEA